MSASKAKDDEPENLFDAGFLQPKYLQVTSDLESLKVHWWIHADISDVYYYTPLIEFLLNVKSGDETHIHIASHGGDLDTALTIVNAIQSAIAAGAEVIGHAEGHVISAGTIILFSCSKVNLNHKHSYFLFHDASMTSGSTFYHELKNTVNFQSMVLENLYNDVFSSVFTESEITDILNTGDKHFYTCDDVYQRVLSIDPDKLYKEGESNGELD